MSLTDKKSALFGKAPSKSSATVGAPAPTTAMAKVLATVGTGLATSTMSPAAIEKKRAEARDWEERGEKNLRTSIFQWSPDYLAAAPCFENASNVYATIGDMNKARDTLVLSADYSEKANCLTTAAFTYSKVGALCSSINEHRQSAGFYSQSAELYGLDGAIDKMADMLSRAAKEWVHVDKAKAQSVFLQACERMFPKATPADAVAKLHPKVLDIFRDAFLFFVTEKMFSFALSTARRSIEIFTAFESDVSLCKMLTSVTIIQLSAGNVVQADDTFLQEHLSIAVYLRSKECALAEDLLTAMKSRDVEKLDAAQRSPDLTYLERDVQALAKTLTINGANDWPEPREEAPTANQHKQSQSTLPVSVSADTAYEAAAVADAESSTEENDLAVVAGTNHENGVDEEEIDIC